MSSEASTGLLAFLDATRSRAHLAQVCRSVAGNTLVWVAVMHNPGRAEEVTAVLAQTGLKSGRAVCAGDDGGSTARALLGEHPCATVACIPCEAELDLASLSAPGLLSDSGRVTPLLPAVRMQSQEDARCTSRASGWAAPAELAIRLLTTRPRTSEWTLPNLITEMEGSGRCYRWDSGRIQTAGLTASGSVPDPEITTRSRILAVVPHYRCEEWLAQCLYCLTTQTRPPDGIVVVDDGSGAPPREIVRSFPEVTLWSSPANIGPENILHEVIRRTDYDAYMVQDADDWCSQDRLERSLEEAERTGAEMIGTQELRITRGQQEILLRIHPLDVNRAMSKKVSHYVCHGASMIARGLALRVGGFDHTLTVGADTDFVLRASHAGRIVNLPAFHYYRRMRPGSRTSSAGTGFGSKIRAAEAKSMLKRASRNRKLKKAGLAPQVRAPERPDACDFLHLLGPTLAMAFSRDEDRSRW